MKSKISKNHEIKTILNIADTEAFYPNEKDYLYRRYSISKKKKIILLGAIDLEVKYKGVNVLEDQSLREGIKEFSDWPTIPQLYIKKEFVGGCDIVKEMYENGELKKILEDKNINHKK